MASIILLISCKIRIVFRYKIFEFLKHLINKKMICMSKILMKEVEKIVLMMILSFLMIK
jgi:hypothetical protein